MMDEITVEEKNSVVSIHDPKRDMQLSIRLHRWILKPIGVWPKSADISWIGKFVYFLINVICTCLVSFLLIPSIVYIVLEMNDTYLILKLSGALCFCVTAIMKYSSLMLRENDIRSGIRHIESDWINTRNYKDRNIMIKSAKFSRRLAAICAFFMYGSAAFYYVALPFSAGKVTEDDGNLTYRPLVYPIARVIVDARYSPISEILFWVQCLSGFIAHGITAGCCSLAAVFVMHAYGRLEILIQWIEHLVDGREDLYDNVDERLAMIVQQHIRILRFISLTNKVLREISFVEVVGCTLNTCFVGYFSMMEWESRQPASYITYFVLLISLTFNIFIFCYIGELVTEKCKKVGEVSYTIDWHRLPGRRALAIILMIAMSNTSVKLTAGNFFELSLSTFGDVIKTSLAYLNMLRTLTT